jgi:DNA-binding transcriptional ArsR family regulator
LQIGIDGGKLVDVAADRKRRSRKYGGRAALDAIASPIRQELLMALGDGRASVRELAARLGRSRSALHYHAGVLERAEMIECVEVRGQGREREKVYAYAADAMALQARSTAAELDASRRAGEAALRLTAREFARAHEDARRGAPPRVALAARGKARLTRAALARVQAKIDELLGVFAEESAESATPDLYAITVVLTPSRDVNAPAPDKRRRRRSR